MTDAEIFEKIDFARGFVFSCQVGSDEERKYNFKPHSDCTVLLKSALRDELLTRRHCERFEKSETEITAYLNGEQAFFVGATLCGVNFDFEYDDQKYYIALFDKLWKADRTGGTFAMHFAVLQAAHSVLDSPEFNPVLIFGR